MPDKEVEDFLAHYASQYYDPVKAHEYYLENRKLTPRVAATPKGASKAERANLAAQRKALALTRSNQAQAISYVTKQIGDKRKQDLAGAKATIVKQRAELKASSLRQQKQSAANLQKGLTRLLGTQPVPANASPAIRKVIEAQNKAKLAKAISENKINISSLKKQISKAAASASKAYTANVKAIDAKYKQALATEKANIKAQVK